MQVEATTTFDMAARFMIGVLLQDFEVFGNDYKANFLVGNCGIGLAEVVYSITGIRQRHRHSADFQGQLRDTPLCGRRHSLSWYTGIDG